jgi:hypothetical protein
MATRARGKRGRPSKRAAQSKRGKRFADLPNHDRMRRRSPESAPRLFEWLVDNGYIEAVPTYRRKTANRRARRR